MSCLKAALRMRQSELSIPLKRKLTDIFLDAFRHGPGRFIAFASTALSTFILIRHRVFNHKDHIDRRVLSILRVSAGVTNIGKAFISLASSFTKCISAPSRRKAPGKRRLEKWLNWP